MTDGCWLLWVLEKTSAAFLKVRFGGAKHCGRYQTLAR